MKKVVVWHAISHALLPLRGCGRQTPHSGSTPESASWHSVIFRRGSARSFFNDLRAAKLRLPTAESPQSALALAASSVLLLEAGAARADKEVFPGAGKPLRTSSAPRLPAESLPLSSGDLPPLALPPLPGDLTMELARPGFLWVLGETGELRGRCGAGSVASRASHTVSAKLATPRRFKIENPAASQQEQNPSQLFCRVATKSDNEPPKDLQTHYWQLQCAVASRRFHSEMAMRGYCWHWQLRAISFACFVLLVAPFHKITAHRQPGDNTRNGTSIPFDASPAFEEGKNESSLSLLTSVSSLRSPGSASELAGVVWTAGMSRESGGLTVRPERVRWKVTGWTVSHPATGSTGPAGTAALSGAAASDGSDKQTCVWSANGQRRSATKYILTFRGRWSDFFLQLLPPFFAVLRRDDRGFLGWAPANEVLRHWIVAVVAQAACAHVIRISAEHESAHELSEVRLCAD